MSKYLILVLLMVVSTLSLSAQVSADSTPALSRHTVVGMLSLRKGEPATFIVNPMSRSRYTLHIKNTESVSRLIKKADFLGLVRVQMDVFPKLAESSPVKILKIERVHVRQENAADFIDCCSSN